MAGAMLAARDLRLPWLVAAFIHLAQTIVAAKMLQETLPLKDRKPLRWKSTNPLSFGKLFVRGSQARLLAAVTIWQSVFDERNARTYSEMHQQELLGWGLEQRGRFASYRGLFSIFGDAPETPIPLSVQRGPVRGNATKA